MAAGRIYAVEDESTLSLVRAMGPVQALQHVTASKYSVRLATAEDAVMYCEAGGKVETTKQILDLEGKAEQDGQTVGDGPDNPEVGADPQ